MKYFPVSVLSVRRDLGFVGRYTVVAALVTIAGCASSPSSMKAEPLANRLRGQTMVLTGSDAKFQIHSPSSMGAKLGAGVAGGLIGSTIVGQAAALSDGEEVVRKTGLVDPALEISRQISERMVENFDVRPVGDIKKFNLTYRNQILKSAGSTGQFVLDLRTEDWTSQSTDNHLMVEPRYNSIYRLEANLIEVESGLTLAKGSCRYSGRLNSQRPTYYELLDNNGARLHDDMQAYTKACVAELWDQMFARHVPAKRAQQSPDPAAVSMGMTDAKPSPASQPVARPDPMLLPLTAPAPASKAVPLNTEAPRQPQTDAVMADANMAERFRRYTTRPNPKAFAVSDSGGWWMAWGESQNPAVKETITQRALRGCEERSKSRCVLYAVDDKVVFGQGADTKR